MRVLLQRSLTPSARVADPDWSGFWPAIVRGVEDARERRPEPIARSERWWRPRWALGGALAAVVIVSLTLWQTVLSPLAPEDPVVVSSAHTEDPRGTVMVYSTHEKDVTVVWVLGLED